MREPLFMTVYGQKHEMYFNEREQENSVEGLCLLSMEDGYLEPWCDVVIYTCGCAANEGYVKNYSENTGLDTWLEENGIAVPTGKWIQPGYVRLPQYRFDMDKVNRHTWTWR